MNQVAASDFSGRASRPNFWTIPPQQIRLCLWWLVGGILGIFLLNALLDVGVLLAEPIFLIVLLISWLAIAVGSFSAAWRGRHEGRTVIPAVAMPVWALTVFALLFVPTGRLGGYTQAAVILFLNRTSYEGLMANPNVSAPGLRAKWAQSGGSGDSAIWSFGYGGFLTMDRDIVYDPMGRPEERAVKLLDAQAASCRALWSHYYDCLLDY